MEGGGSGRRPSWEREEQFRSLLHRAAKKASREMIDTIADIAVRDDKVVSCWATASRLPARPRVLARARSAARMRGPSRNQCTHLQMPAPQRAYQMNPGQGRGRCTAVFCCQHLP